MIHLPRPPKVLGQILGLKHAVVTSVTRDDLPDEGANQFAAKSQELAEAFIENFKKFEAGADAEVLKGAPKL